jgi:hypothetical protein
MVMKDLFSILWAILIMAFLCWAILRYATRPQVEFSWSTKECVRVKYGDPKWNCHNLPPDYIHVWVK